MLKSETLLVCLSPSIPHQEVDELCFYDMINPVAEVSNIKVIDKEGQMKAFVELSDRDATGLVIKAFHKKHTGIGKFKVFVSNKSRLVYSRSIVDILQQREETCKFHLSRQETLTGIKLQTNEGEINPVSKNNSCLEKKKALDLRAKISFNYQRNPNNSQDQQLLRQNYHTEMALYANPPIISNCTLAKVDDLYRNETTSKLFEVQITHKNATFLREKKVLRSFKRFGRIVNCHFDPEKNSWKLRYRFTSEVQKIICIIEKNQFCDYQLAEDKRNYLATNPRNEKIEDSFGGQHTYNNHNFSYFLSETPKIESAYLCIYANKRMTDIDVAKLVSRTHKPIELVQSISSVSKQLCFKVRFNYVYEASEVMIALTRAQKLVICGGVNIE